MGGGYFGNWNGMISGQWWSNARSTEPSGNGGGYWPMPRHWPAPSIIEPRRIRPDEDELLLLLM